VGALSLAACVGTVGAALVFPACVPESDPDEDPAAVDGGLARGTDGGGGAGASDGGGGAGGMHGIGDGASGCSSLCRRIVDCLELGSSSSSSSGLGGDRAEIEAACADACGSAGGSGSSSGDEARFFDCARSAEGCGEIFTCFEDRGSGSSGGGAGGEGGFGGDAGVFGGP
jgi:hypothetical protein